MNHQMKDVWQRNFGLKRSSPLIHESELEETYDVQLEDKEIAQKPPKKSLLNNDCIPEILLNLIES